MFEPLQNPTLNYILVAGALVVSVVILIALHSSPPYVRRWVIAGVTLLVGLYVPLEFYIPRHNFLTVWRDPLSDLVRVLAGFTIGLGIVNLVIVHGRHILQRTANFPFSLAFFVGFISMAFVGFLHHYKPDLWAQKPGEGELAFWSAAYKVFFEGLLLPLTSTVFSLLAFFIVSAAYRAFRIRTLEAGLLMAAAIIVMLANVPVGTWLTSWLPQEGWLKWLRLENAALWLTTQINAPAMRGILFGAAVGGLGAALRILLSLEKSFSFGGQG